MQFETIDKVKEDDFLQLVGISRKAFDKTAQILKVAEQKKKAQGGKPNNFS